MATLITVLIKIMAKNQSCSKQKLLDYDYILLSTSIIMAFDYH